MNEFHFAMSTLKRTRSLEVVGSDATTVGGIFTQVTSRRSKKSRRGKAVQPNDITADVAATAGSSTEDAVVVATETVGVGNVSSQAAADSETKCCCKLYSDCCNSAEIIESLKLELQDTKLELEQMKVEVERLTSHVSLLSRTIGVPVQPVSQEDAAQSVLSASVGTIHEASLSTQSNTVTTQQTAHPKSYAAAVAPAIRNFQRNVVSAVYSDLQEKERRSNNIIISGLKNTDYRDEKDVVTGMIYDEFGKNSC